MGKSVLSPIYWMRKAVVANIATRTPVHPESVGYGFYQLLCVETPLQYVLPHTYSVNVTLITFTNENKIGVILA